MGTVFRKYRQTLVPTSHQRTYGQAFQWQLGDVEDTLVDRAKQALKARMPLVAPSDALAALGNERQIPRGPSESDAAYALRLRAAWSTWPWAGTAFGVLSALFALGYSNVVLATQGGIAYRLTLDGLTLLVSTLSAGSWFIDANRAPAGTVPWTPNTAFAAAATVVPSSMPWTPNTSFPSGTVVRPTASNQLALYYRSSGGTSGTSEPQWPTTPSLQVADNSLVWTAIRRDFWFKTPLAGTSGATQPVWPPTFAGMYWAGFNWGDARGLTVADNTITWSAAGSDFWSRFDVVFPAPLASGQTSGTSDEANLIRAIVKAWRPGYTTNNRITIVTGGIFWGAFASPIWGAFTWATGIVWNAFNWGAATAKYATGATYARASSLQYGGAGLTWGSSSTLNWNGG